MAIARRPRGLRRATAPGSDRGARVGVAGMVSRPGTSTWGEILDLSEIEVRCELTLDQVERVQHVLRLSPRLRRLHGD